MTKGRPKLPEGERMEVVGIRLPQWLIAYFRERGQVTVEMRKALEQHALEDNHE